MHPNARLTAPLLRPERDYVNAEVPGDDPAARSWRGRSTLFLCVSTEQLPRS